MKIVTHCHIYHTILALFGVTALSWEQAKGQEAPISVGPSHSKPGKTRGFDAFGFRIASLSWPVAILLLAFSGKSYGADCPVTITANFCNIVVGKEGKVQLTSSPAGSYLWNTGATTQTIWVPISGAENYTVTVTGTGCSSSNNTASFNVGTAIGDLVVNGNFTAGNTGFTSAYTYVAAPGQLNAQGLYAITPDVAPRFPNIMYGRDHTVGNGNSPNNFLAINGADAANKTIWTETVNVVPNTDYYFTVFAMDLSRNLRMRYKIDLI